MPVLLRTLALIVLGTLCAAACAPITTDGDSVAAGEPPLADDGEERSGTRIKRIWVSTGDGTNVPWTGALWDDELKGPCFPSGPLAGDVGGPYCVPSPQRTAHAASDFSDPECSLPAIHAWEDFAILRSGCDYRVFEKVRDAPNQRTTYRRSIDGKCERFDNPLGSDWRATRPAPTRLQRLFMTPLAGPERLRPWRVETEDGLRATALGRSAYDNRAGATCWLGGRDGEEETNECRIIGSREPVLDERCSVVVGVSVSRDCTDAPVATRPPAAASRVADCHQEVFSAGDSVVGAGGLGALSGSTCVPYAGPPRDPIMRVGSAFGAATFRREVAPSGGRLRPVFDTAEDGTTLAVDHYWDTVQEMGCSIEWTSRDAAASCRPIAVSSSIAFLSPSCDGEHVIALDLPLRCRGLPAQILAFEPGATGDDAKVVEVVPAPERDYYRRGSTGAGYSTCARIPRPTALFGKRLRAVRSIPLKVEIR